MTDHDIDLKFGICRFVKISRNDNFFNCQIISSNMNFFLLKFFQIIYFSSKQKQSKF